MVVPCMDASCGRMPLTSIGSAPLGSTSTVANSCVMTAEPSAATSDTETLVVVSVVGSDGAGIAMPPISMFVLID